MNEVDAVKDESLIGTVGLLLEKHKTLRERHIWEFGINTALRITDLLSIKFSDIERDQITLKEGKTDKKRVITLNPKALEIVETRKRDNPGHIYLFQSVGRNTTTVKPVSRQFVGKAFQEIGQILDISLNTHSMRKTRGYHLYKSGVQIETITKLLNHSSPSVTLRYIGIDSDTIKSTYMDLVL